MAFDDNVDKRQAQEEDRKKKRKVYSTALVDQLIKERSMGYDIPFDAFYNRDLELRAPGVTFRMTDEEMEEYQKCYDDALYFVMNYCRFMTDNGRALVDLRDYQKRVIKAVTDEDWNDEINDLVPKNRSLIWTAARQSGKCVVPWTKVRVKNEHTGEIEEIPLYKLYKKTDGGLSFIEHIKHFLYYIMSKL